MTAPHDVVKNNIWPWTRYMARAFDLSIISSFFIFILYFIVPTSFIKYELNLLADINDESLYKYLLYYIQRTIELQAQLNIELIIQLFIYTIIDSLICFKFGRNLGHKIFGLQLKNKTGHELHYKDYLKRSFLVSVFFFFLESPLFYLFFIPALIFYINYKKTGETYWDRLSGITDLSKNASTKRTILLTCFCYFANFVLLLVPIIYSLDVLDFIISLI